MCSNPESSFGSCGGRGHTLTQSKCGYIYECRSKTGCAELFPVVMACMVAGIDKYGDLMRMAIATPGNDFRLGGMEAPPAVISTYLGEDMTNYLNEFVAGEF